MMRRPRRRDPGGGRRRVFLAVTTAHILACACLCAASAAGNPHLELKFATGLRELGYYELAVEQFRALNWAGQGDVGLRNAIAEGLVDTCLAAAQAAPRATEALSYTRLAAEELAAFLKVDLDASLRPRLEMKHGEVLLARGRLARAILLRQPPGVDLAAILAEGRESFLSAMAAFRRSADGYKALVKRIEAKDNVSDADRRLRHELLNEQMVAETQICWARFRLGQLLRQEKKDKEAQEEFNAAAKGFTELATAHSDKVAGVSAALGKALCLQEVGQHKDALPAFDAVLEFKAAVAGTAQRSVAELRFQAHYGKAESQAALGDYRAALAILEGIGREFGTLPREYAEMVQMRQACILGGWADAQRAEARKKLTEAESLVKKGDADSVRRGTQLRQQAEDLRRQYRELYEKAAGVLRHLVVSDSDYAQEANLLLGQWIAAGELTIRRSATELFAEGERLMATGEWAAAIDAYRQVILESGDTGPGRKLSHDAWIQMGKAYVQLKRYYEAGLVLGNVARLYPDSEYAEKAAEYSAMLLGAQYQQGQTPFEAEIYLESQALLAERYPDNEAARRAAIRLADLRREQRRYTEAAHYYRKIGPASEFYERACYLAGWCLWQGALAKGLEGAGPRSAPAEAVALAGEAEKQLWGFLAWAEKQPRGSDQAEAARREWTARARLLLAEMFVYEGVGRPADALQVLAGFEKRHERPAELPLVLAARLLRLRANCAVGTAEAAQAAAAELQELPTDDPVVGRQRKSAAARLVGVTFAALAQQRAKARAPEAEVRALAESARTHLLEAIELNPEQTLEDYAAIATGLYQAGMYLEAARTFQRVVERFGQSPEHQEAVWDARVWIGRAYKEAGQWQEAAAAFEELAKTKKFAHALEVRRSLAICYARMSRLDAATREWTRVEESVPQGTPEWFEARYHRVALAAQQGRKDFAYQVLASTVVAYPDLGGGESQKRFEKLMLEQFTKEQQERLGRLRQGAIPAP